MSIKQRSQKELERQLPSFMEKIQKQQGYPKDFLGIAVIIATPMVLFLIWFKLAEILQYVVKLGNIRERDGQVTLNIHK